MVDLFIQGGYFMYPLLLMFFFGVVVAFERFWTLSKAHINAKEFMVELQDALKQNGPDGAAELCSNTRGPVATVLHAGLLRLDRGIDHVEKSIEESGAIEMAFLERGMVWLSTVANLAPLVGFLGTVSGMIRAFNDIAAAGDVDPSVVAGGISEALLTTAGGLMVAIPVQAAYNFFLAKIDKIIIDLQESSNQFIDDLIRLGYGQGE
jgi:biopolymer transport protein ExbB